MDRAGLIKKYILNFNELESEVQRDLLTDLKVFYDSMLAALIKKKARIIILPSNEKFTDIKAYSRWKGKPFCAKRYGKHRFYKTFDEVRGWGGNPAVIGEEWVLAKDKHVFNVVRHEIAHQIYANIPDKNLSKMIGSAYKNAKKNGFIRDNSSISQSEYFADGVTFFFNRSPPKKIRIFDMNQICNKRLLSKKDKRLYGIIKGMF